MLLSIWWTLFSELLPIMWLNQTGSSIFCEHSALKMLFQPCIVPRKSSSCELMCFHITKYISYISICSQTNFCCNTLVEILPFQCQSSTQLAATNDGVFKKPEGSFWTSFFLIQRTKHRVVLVLFAYKTFHSILHHQWWDWVILYLPFLQ